VELQKYVIVEGNLYQKLALDVCVPRKIIIGNIFW